MGGASIAKSCGFSSKALIISLLPFLPVCYGEEVVDRVAAVVGGHPILHSEVARKVSNGPLIIVSDYPSEEASPPYQRALNDRINFELISTHMKNLDADVESDEVEQEIDRYLAQKGIDRTYLKNALEQEGVSYEKYKEDFKRQLVIANFHRRMILPNIKLTDRDVELYYLRKMGNSGADAMEVELKVIQFVISSPGTDIEAAKVSLADEVWTKIKEGLPIDEAVKLYSEAANARTTGGLFRTQLKSLHPDIRKAVEPLKEGEFTRPLRLGDSIQILHLGKRNFRGGEDFRKQRAQLEIEMRNKEILEESRRWISSERGQAKVQIIE